MARRGGRGTQIEPGGYPARFAYGSESVHAKRRFTRDIRAAISVAKILRIPGRDRAPSVHQHLGVVTQGRVFVRSWSLKPEQSHSSPEDEALRIAVLAALPRPVGAPR